MPLGPTRWPLLALHCHRQPSHWPQRSYQNLRKWSNKADQGRELNRIVGSFWKVWVSVWVFGVLQLKFPGFEPSHQVILIPVSLVYFAARLCPKCDNWCKQQSLLSQSHAIMQPNMFKMHCCTLNEKLFTLVYLGTHWLWGRRLQNYVDAPRQSSFSRRCLANLTAKGSIKANQKRRPNKLRVWNSFSFFFLSRFGIFFWISWLVPFA